MPQRGYTNFRGADDSSDPSVYFLFCGRVTSDAQLLFVLSLEISCKATILDSVLMSSIVSKVGTPLVSGKKKPSMAA